MSQGTGFPGQVQGRDPDANTPNDVYAKSGALYTAVRYFNSGGVPTAQGQIALASQQSLLAKYAFSNADTADATYYYIGKEDKDGNWFIMRIAKADYSTQYAAGTSGYSTEWTNRAAPTGGYGSFSNKF